MAGSAIDVPLSEQGSSIAIVPREEIAERNEGLAVDLLRYLPGITIGQTGSPGGVADMFIRGGNYNFNLVADRRRPGELVRRRFRLRAHTHRLAGARGGDRRGAILGLRGVCQ